MEDKQYHHVLKVFNKGIVVCKLKWTSTRRQIQNKNKLEFTTTGYKGFNYITIEYTRTKGAETVKRIWEYDNDEHFDHKKGVHSYCKGHVDKGWPFVHWDYGDSRIYDTKYFYVRWETKLFSDMQYDQNVGMDGKHPIMLSLDFMHLFPKLFHKYGIYHWMLWRKVKNDVELLKWLIQNSEQNYQHFEQLGYKVGLDVLNYLKLHNYLDRYDTKNIETNASHGDYNKIKWHVENNVKVNALTLRMLLKQAQKYNGKLYDRDNSKVIEYLENIIIDIPVIESSGNFKQKYEHVSSKKDKVLYIKCWFLCENDKYVGRDTVCVDYLFNLNAALQILSAWDAGTNINDIPEDTINFIFNHPAFKNYNSINEFVAYS